MKRLMLIVALLPTLATAAEQQKKSVQPPKKNPVAANPCAQYGDGFVQLQGTTTCVRLNGSIRMETGGRVR